MTSTMPYNLMAHEFGDALNGPREVFDSCKCKTVGGGGFQPNKCSTDTWTSTSGDMRQTRDPQALGCK